MLSTSTLNLVLQSVLSPALNSRLKLDSVTDLSSLAPFSNVEQTWMCVQAPKFSLYFTGHVFSVRHLTVDIRDVSNQNTEAWLPFG